MLISRLSHHQSERSLDPADQDIVGAVKFSEIRQWVLHDEFYYVSRVEMTDILIYSFNRFAINTFDNRKSFEFSCFLHLLLHPNLFGTIFKFYFLYGALEKRKEANKKHKISTARSEGNYFIDNILWQTNSFLTLLIIFLCIHCLNEKPVETGKNQVGLWLN